MLGRKARMKGCNRIRWRMKFICTKYVSFCTQIHTYTSELIVFSRKKDLLKKAFGDNFYFVDNMHQFFDTILSKKYILSAMFFDLRHFLRICCYFWCIFEKRNWLPYTHRYEQKSKFTSATVYCRLQ
jgi:hypothetical protein